ncbi:MAG: Xaa-Pro aminopeptidase [Thiothrix sp.]|uniref:Xaa-Pro aminopeptidase n=1 Tax=Thiothrix sp. TaxID=1032 RepID=UPI00260E41BC|nr:Xaa-Pro aminopeptidase [Thiothrix sp.]MDD5392124.1 Xaa-Pro aminopeptidase [Thiothrix sp.]
MDRPVIPKEEFAARRRRLLERLGKDAIAVVPSGGLKVRNRDAEYPFRQDSDFHYLTGFNEPEAVAVFVPGREAGEYVLFCREKDPQAERWSGLRAGLEGVKHLHGADDAHPIGDLDKLMPQLLTGRDSVHYDLGANAEFDQQMLGWINQLRAKARAGIRAPHVIVMLDRILHEMRLFKSPAEVAVMRHAAQVSARAHTRAMQVCQPGKIEYEIEAEFLHEFRRAGMEPAYTTIVGGGENACILHYIENRAVLRDGDLLLIDAGAEHECYASDITRTFPVNGKFSVEQRALYQLVLDAQKAAIDQARPGKTWDDPHQAAVRVLAEGLLQLGLLQGDIDGVLKKGPENEDEPYRQFYMHKTGHWLGMDVHDVGDYKIGEDWRTLQPGMVLTVEPGLYISPAENVDPKWWNIGIRIEDDVLITEEGNEVLSRDVVKEVADIEGLMAA